MAGEVDDRGGRFERLDLEGLAGKLYARSRCQPHRRFSADVGEVIVLETLVDVLLVLGGERADDEEAPRPDVVGLGERHRGRGGGGARQLGGERQRGPRGRGGLGSATADHEGACAPQEASVAR